jgi:ABC-2 type transport system ATP-binding protein
VRELIDLVRAHYRQPLARGAVERRFELGAFVDRQLGGLSGGERRRVAVALAFAGAPKLVVLDEPTTGLDVASRHAVWGAIRGHVEEGGTILLTTHDLEEADALAQRVVLIEAGRITADAMVAVIKFAAGLTRISFRAEDGVSVAGGDRDGDRMRLLVHDGGAEVERLVRAGVRLRELEVRPLTLEEALAARNGRE